MRPLVIGTRGSSLARCQAQIVQTRLEEHAGGRPVVLKAITAQADRKPEAPLAALEGEGVFVKELEAALLDGAIDLAVHSLKDLPLDTPGGLEIAAVLAREEPRDALVSRTGQGLRALAAGSRVGTSSLRRASQLRRLRHDLEAVPIRGNVDTRLRKLSEGHYDAVLLAACGLIRLGLESRITEFLDLEVMLPEPGQGALAVETRQGDAGVRYLVSALEDPVTRACTEAERAFLRALGGGCRVPIAAYAEERHGTLTLQGAVVAPDGSTQVRGVRTGPMTEPEALGTALAGALSAQGARDLLALVKST